MCFNHSVFCYHFRTFCGKYQKLIFLSWTLFMYPINPRKQNGARLLTTSIQKCLNCQVNFDKDVIRLIAFSCDFKTK